MKKENRTFEAIFVDLGERFNTVIVMALRSGAHRDSYSRGTQTKENWDMVLALCGILRGSQADEPASHEVLVRVSVEWSVLRHDLSVEPKPKDPEVKGRRVCIRKKQGTTDERV